jgi:ubiquinone/menaquinone biosynthesis C-methylase UbiE
MEHAQKATVEKILQYVNLRDKDVLEVGCGDGRMTALFADITQSLVAIDPDVERLAQAQAKVPGVDFRVGSGEHLEFADESFDAIIFTLSLHHQESATALQEAYRVVKPQGNVVVVEPSGKGQIEQICRLFHNEAIEQENAQKVIMNSAFEVKHHEAFETEWIFENNDELYAGFFEYYDTEPTEALIADIDRFLGSTRDECPLIVNDMLQLSCLRKSG